MKTLTINTNGLLNAVATASSFTPRDGEFIGKLVMVGNDGKLQVKASDYIQTVIFKDISFLSSDLTDTDFKAISIDGKKLLTVLKAAKTAEVKIDINANDVIVKSGRSRVKIDTLVNTQEIEIKSGNGNSFDFSSQIKSFEQILHSADSNNTRPELNGVLLQVKDGVLNVVGTDTKRLACITSETDLVDTQIIVPKSSIQTIIKLFNCFNVSAELTDVTLSAHTDSVSYQTKLINGKYPEWQRIVPQSFSQSLVIERVRLLELVKEVSLFDPQIIINIKAGKILLEDFEGSTKVEDVYGDENANIKFAINAKSIIDFLASYDEDNVQIGFNGANLPVMLIASLSYKEVCMPIVMAEEVKDDARDDARAAA
jgi:DNA polymerase-3 subunit beta